MYLKEIGLFSPFYTLWIGVWHSLEANFLHLSAFVFAGTCFSELVTWLSLGWSWCLLWREIHHLSNGKQSASVCKPKTGDHQAVARVKVNIEKCQGHISRLNLERWSLDVHVQGSKLTFFTTSQPGQLMLKSTGPWQNLSARTSL